MAERTSLRARQGRQPESAAGCGPGNVESKNEMWCPVWLRVGVMMLTAGLLGGVCRAATWFPLGPFGGDVRSFAADPSDPSHHLFLGTATGWIYDSHDGGESWTRVAQIADRNDLAVDHILVDKSNPKRILVAAWVIGKSTDGGIFVSEDYGKTWYSQAEMRGQSVRSLARSASDPKLLVAGTLTGVFRSNDNGRHWKRISPAGNAEIHEVESVAIDPADPNVIYAGTWHLPWKTTDGGVTWHSIKTGLIDDSDVFSIIVDPKQPSVVYASACSGIYKSADSGELFHKVQGIPSTARRTRKLAQDPEQLDTVFAGTTEGLYRTLDAGKQWERMTPADVIVNDVYVDPNDSKRVLLATERGGIYRSDDGGGTFESSNEGFTSRQISAFAQDSTQPNTLYIGVVNDKRAGGVFQSTDGAVHWQQQSEGLDGRDVFSLVSLSDGTLLAGTAHGVMRFDGGTWKDSSLLAGVTVEKVGLVVPRSRSGAATLAKRVMVPPVVKPATYRGPKHKPAPAGRISVFTRPGGRGVHPVAKQKRAGVASRLQHGSHLVRVGVHAHRVAPQDAAASRKAAPKSPGAARAGGSIAGGIHEAEKPAQPGHISAKVYTLANIHGQILAGTGDGLLRSDDAGLHWRMMSAAGPTAILFLASHEASANPAEAGAPPVLLAADLSKAFVSSDGGNSWSPVVLPAGLTQIGAVGIDGEGHYWIGGREGVWFSQNHGASWQTLRDLFLTQVDSLFYDAAQHRMLVTAANSRAAFSVQLPDRKVTHWDTGWRLRFLRPVGDHLVGATLFDGMVVQPEMVATPVTAAAVASPK